MTELEESNKKRTVYLFAYKQDVEHSTVTPLCLRTEHPLYDVCGQKYRDSMGQHVIASLRYIEIFAIFLFKLFRLKV